MVVYALVLLLLLAGPAAADTFVERWPATEAVAPAPLPPTPPPAPTHQRLRQARAEHRAEHHHHHRARFVCHRQTYYIGRHRYWRCRR